jgi:hypothetical protein
MSLNSKKGTFPAAFEFPENSQQRSGPHVHIPHGGGSDHRAGKRHGNGPGHDRNQYKKNPTMNPPAAGSTENEMKTTAADVPAKGPDFVNLQNSDMLSSNVARMSSHSTSTTSTTTISAKSRTSLSTARKR